MNKKSLYGIMFSAAALAMTGCTDGELVADQNTYPHTDSLQNLLYLNDYGALKTYVDRTVNPDFKLGIGVGAQNYVDGKIDGRLTNANFNEMTAGNAMKFASCVSDDGTMDFNLVTKFVAAAKEANVTIYGHTLAWHSQQNNKYLNSLLEDKQTSGGDAVMVDIQNTLSDFSTMTKFPFYVMGYEPAIEDGVLKSSNPGSWYQYFVISDFATPLPETYKVTAMVRSSKNGSIGIQMGNWGATFSQSMSVSTEWEEQSVTFDNLTTEKSFVVFQPGTFDGDLEVKWVKVTHQVAANKVPLTDQEKKDTLTWAMDRWIDGMMKACDGYVTTWEVANETVSGSDKDGDGILDLQSATRNTVSDEDKKNMFYWQDYMGDIDYVRTAVRLARKHFAEYNGDPSKLKLFINDYNLESFWDDNWKMKSLLEWINRWEADGETNIDGIATQMHVACSEDSTVQKSREDHVVKMFQLMAQSGKLCKISELDMGYVAAKRDADGNLLSGDGDAVKTEDMTDAQHKQMADFYQFIIEKYFEIIPPAQRYGITQWCITDAPKDSGWRKGEPVGLWTLDYNRKRAFGGFAEGLKKSSVSSVGN